ncbi:hypothetical protein Ae201684P_000147 [Aphanomyces euteiches]|uniref:Uncharacterized protein n=1 Tax=Aphanomyces euteiches TaxID=100861 RepID=A0A6G0XR40_9STRA|nr:hypothetical protein Ae201684_002074 [Aphanomyces euteiches]KAH9086725.1 hypothetical protein Ae201684P_000147 [Aphanomyces euteiches]
MSFNCHSARRNVNHVSRRSAIILHFTNKPRLWSKFTFRSEPSSLQRRLGRSSIFQCPLSVEWTRRWTRAKTFMNMHAALGTRTQPSLTRLEEQVPWIK